MTTPVSPASAEELKPCPFCGRTPLISHAEFGGVPVSAIRCCFADTGRRCDDKDAIAVWNMRAPAPSGAKVPAFLVSDAERAIHETAEVEASRAAAVLRYALAAAPVPPDPPKEMR